MNNGGSGNGSNGNIQRSSSFKKFRRSSSKRTKTKPKTKSESDANEIILNNHNNNNNNQLRRNDSILSSTNRIINETKDSNKLSPQNSIKQKRTTTNSPPTIIPTAQINQTTVGCGGVIGGVVGGVGVTQPVPTTTTTTTTAASTIRRNSYVFNNSQVYQNLNRRNSFKNYQHNPNNRRRMSSIEHVYQKASFINAYNLENQTIHAFKNSKIDLNKSEKSIISNINLSGEDLHQSQQLQNMQTSQPQIQLMDDHRNVSKIKRILKRLKPEKFTEEREDYSLYMFPRDNQ